MKRIKIILAIVMVLVLGVYLVMFLSTNSVMRELRSVFLLEVDNSETAGRAIDFYNQHYRLEERGIEIGDIYLRLSRSSVRHNFRTGYIRIVYTHRVDDEDGNLVMGAWGISARLRIEKINGTWEITEVCEWLNNWKRDSLFCYP